MAFLYFFESNHSFLLFRGRRTPWTPMLMTAMKLKHLVCFLTKPIHCMPSNFSFPAVATCLMMNRHTKLSSLPTRRPPFQNTLHVHESFSFFSSLAHPLCGSSHVNLWMSLRMAPFCESCLTFFTCIIFWNSIEICDQESVLFIDSNVHLGHPNFVKAWRKIFQHKDSFGVNLIPRNPLLEMTFYKRTVPFVDPTLNWTLVEKACSYLTSSFCVENTMHPLMDCDASKNTKLVSVCIKHQ